MPRRTQFSRTILSRSGWLSRAAMRPRFCMRWAMIGGLSSGRRAEVENVLAGLGIQFIHRQKRAGVLHVKKAALETIALGQGRMRFQFEHQIPAGPIPLPLQEVHSFLLPCRRQARQNLFSKG